MSHRLVPLNPAENVFCQVADAFDGDWTCHVSVLLSGPIQPNSLTLALGALQQRHPKLRARLVQSADGRWSFELCETPPPIPVQIVDTEEELPQLIEDPALWHHGVLGNGATPLIRVHVLRNQTQPASILTLTVHHVLGDGVSQAGLVKDLLTYYAEAHRTGSPAAVSPLPFVAVERAVPSGTFWTRAGILLSRLRYALNARRGFVDVPGDESSSQLPLCRRWRLTQRESLALIHRCRREDTSVYGVLLAASMLGMKAALKQPSIRAACRCPINLRGHLESVEGPVTDDDLGYFCFPFRQIYEADEETSFWDLARKARRDAVVFAEGGGGPLLYNLFSRLFRARPRLFTDPKDPSPPKRFTLQVSYVGLLDRGKTDDDLRVLDWSMGVTAKHVGASLMVGAYMLENQFHVLVFGFDLAGEFWDGYLDAMRCELRQAIDAPPAPAEIGSDGAPRE